ncbi:MAG: phage major capsid protein [Clostridiales bacterium]|nr:phage major capsid protein [Clostridiales bacterium]
MVTVQTADSVLKSYYLDAVKDALNMKTNPLMAMIQQTTSNVVGKDIRKTIKSGISGGIGAGTETGNLPQALDGNYMQFVATLKNLYGTIEISDKALRASANNEGSFVNLLNEEMESLLKNSQYNFGRMLYSDGTGTIGRVLAVGGNNTFTFETVRAMIEGMEVDFYDALKRPVEEATKRKVVAVDRVNRTVTFGGPTIPEGAITIGAYAAMHGCWGNEITGVEALFSGDVDNLYGVEKNSNQYMTPYVKGDLGAITEEIIQKAIDEIEATSGSQINVILCSPGVRRSIVKFFRTAGVTLPTMDVHGYKALDFHGIPIIADRFCTNGTMYFLNTNDFKLHQLCDWQWLEGEDGKILKQVPGKPVYTATLVKYAELICERPCGQGKIYGVTES